MGDDADRVTALLSLISSDKDYTSMIISATGIGSEGQSQLARVTEPLEKSGHRLSKQSNG